MSENDPDDVQDAAAERQADRAATVEETLTAVRDDLGEQSYPVSSEELGARYGTDPEAVANETEWVGSAFDRMDEQFADEGEAYDALETAYEAGDHPDAAEALPETSDRRAGEDEVVDDAPERAPSESRREGSSAEDARRRARETQAETADDANAEDEADDRC
jgi:hypothetical protein